MALLKSTLRLLAIIIVLFIAYFIGVIMVNTVNDYKPQNCYMKLTDSDVIEKDTLHLLSWNIGYAGMGKEMDFFYDGGKMVRPSYDYYQQCFDSILHFLAASDSKSDICLLQEVDFDSKRSYYINQKQQMAKVLKTKEFADSLINYQVSFVAFPLYKPLGKVSAGLVTFSSLKPSWISNVYFGETYSWPKQVFFLDRGILIHAYKTRKGKFLFVINVHLSAFDDAVEARAEELNLLQTVLSAILKHNHYLIVAGDWNINPPQFYFSNNVNFKCFYTEPNTFECKNTAFYYDTLVPTNRKADMPYIKHKTPVTTLDYILCSNNLDIINYKVIDLDFKFSDHNPIAFSVVLK